MFRGINSGRNPRSAERAIAHAFKDIAATAASRHGPAAVVALEVDPSMFDLNLEWRAAWLVQLSGLFGVHFGAPGSSSIASSISRRALS